MRYLVQCTIPLFVGACLSAGTPVPAPQDPISPLEYDLIATAILVEATTIFALDSTEGISCPTNQTPPLRFASTCAHMANVTDPVPWAAFLAVNREAYPISPAALSRRGIKIKGPRPSIDQATCPVGPASIWVSRAAFSPDSSMALLQFHVFAGRGASFNGCGFSGGDLSLWERSKAGVWTKKASYIDSIS